MFLYDISSVVVGCPPPPTLLITANFQTVFWRTVRFVKVPLEKILVQIDFFVFSLSYVYDHSLKYNNLHS